MSHLRQPLPPLPRESLTQEGADGQGSVDESSGASHPAPGPAEPLRARGDGGPGWGGHTEGSAGPSQPRAFHGAAIPGAPESSCASPLATSPRESHSRAEFQRCPEERERLKELFLSPTGQIWVGNCCPSSLADSHSSPVLCKFSFPSASDGKHQARSTRGIGGG